MNYPNFPYIIQVLDFPSFISHLNLLFAESLEFPIFSESTEFPIFSNLTISRFLLFPFSTPPLPLRSRYLNFPTFALLYPAHHSPFVSLFIRTASATCPSVIRTSRMTRSGSLLRSPALTSPPAQWLPSAPPHARLRDAPRRFSRPRYR